MAQSKLGYDLQRLARSATSGAEAFSKQLGKLTTEPKRGITDKDLLMQSGRVLVQAVADSNVNKLLTELTSAGMQQGSVFNQVVSGWMPIGSLAALENVQSLRFATPVYRPIVSTTSESSFANESPLPRVGQVTSEGDLAQRSKQARDQFQVDGSGVKIGVLSDSFNALNGYARDITTGDLPSGVQVLKDLPNNADEGRAMLQIIYDIAPASSLAFRTAFDGPVDFANGIIELARAGSKVIVDDIGYLTQPFFQDGVIAQAVTAVTRAGNVSYFSAAGNNAARSYQSTYRPSTTVGSFQLHDFDPGTGVDNFQNITLSAGQSFRPSFQWDQPFASASTNGAGAKNDLDIFVFSQPTFDPAFLVASSDEDNIDRDPVEFFSFRPQTAGTYYIAIGQFLPNGGPQPSLIKYIDFGSGSIPEYATNSSTSYGHPTAPGGLGVAAANYQQTPAFGVTPPKPEPFTSLGGIPILFDTQGNRLAQPIIRAQPGITAPDAVSTTVPGFAPFFGTSAAAPSAAAAAALLLDADPTATNQEIYEALKSSAIDMSTPGVDFLTGAGLIQVDAAISSLIGGATPPPGPVPPGPVPPGPEVPVVSLAVSPDAVLEDSDQNLIYTFTRTGSTSNALTVNYKVSGSAKVGTDYTGISTTGATKTVTFSAGASTATVKVEVDPTIDFVAEPNETVLLTVTAGTGYTIGTTTDVIGTINNDDIIGTSTSNTLIGTIINEFIDGRGGQDSLTGGFGPDRFGFRFGESRITTPDRITDLEIGSDIIGLISSSGAPLPAPVAFSTAADNSTATTLSALASAVFLDADGSLVGNQPLVANAAALVTATNPRIAGTYLIINDRTAKLSTTSDLLISIASPAGAFTASDLSASTSVFS